MNGKKNKERPDCFRCRFLRITHEPAHPYECRGMGFKSRYLPCLEVVRASGAPCRMFSPK